MELSDVQVEAVVAMREAFASGAAAKWRVAAYETQGSAAALIGVGEITVSRWERGVRQPRPRVALRAAEVYASFAEKAYE